MQNVVTATQFSRKQLDELFAFADKLPTHSELLKGKILASLFYEPSTRTRFSFESAMMRLGGTVISTENASEFSSAAKGETLEDTIQVIQHYADLIVLRHPEPGASEIAKNVSSVPIINAGDGAGEHPTQALLDLYTIQKELGVIDGINIALVGDLKHGRTVRSLARLLKLYKDININFVAPDELQIGEDIINELDEAGVSYKTIADWSSVINKVDVIYHTRIQKERFLNPETYKQLKGAFIFTVEDANKMKDGAIIMHPLPRVDEISVAVDNLKQAAYFRQAKYGVTIRMALLCQLLQKPD